MNWNENRNDDNLNVLDDFAEFSEGLQKIANALASLKKRNVTDNQKIYSTFNLFKDELFLFMNNYLNDFKNQMNDKEIDVTINSAILITNFIKDTINNLDLVTKTDDITTSKSCR